MPEKALEAKLEAVSCFSSTACTATGYYKNGAATIVPLAERWNGEKWELQSPLSPEKAEEASLSGVSCASSTACSAVGAYKTGGVLKPLAEGWNGKSWALQSPPSPEKALETKLEGISCLPTLCIATGYYKNGSGVKLTLAERWKGESWTIESTPNPGGAEEASFKAVSCGAETVCIGTGSYLSSSVSTLAERLEGGWELQSPGNPTGSERTLAAVSCTSAKSCMSAGSYKNGSGIFLPLTESYIRVEAPFNTGIPSVSPTTPETGKAESATTGTWGNEPTSYAYQWKRCNASGLECVNIGGATNSTYSPLEADVEHTLVVEVTASNVVGSASAVSTEKVKKAGLVTEYALPASSTPHGIAPGPDENLWFTAENTNKIGKITTTGSITEYAINTETQRLPIAITKGPDGNLWFSFAESSGRVAKITTSGTITYYTLSKGMNNGREIAAGPDGNLWFTATEGNIGKITTGGTITEYSLPAGGQSKGSPKDRTACCGSPTTEPTRSGRSPPEERLPSTHFPRAANPGTWQLGLTATSGSRRAAPIGSA